MATSVICNETALVIKIYGNGSGDAIKTIQAGEKDILFLDRTYSECSFRASYGNFITNLFFIPFDDLVKFEEIKVLIFDNVFTADILEPTLREAREQEMKQKALEKQALEKQALEKQALEKQALKKQALEKASSKFDAALRSCLDLRELLKTVKICHNQCNHLVRTYVEGIMKLVMLFYKMTEGPPLWCGKSDQLCNALEKLLCICFLDAKKLLEACASAKELGRIALVVSMPTEEYYSRFDLLVGMLAWNLELIEYALLYPSRAVRLEWCPTVHRYVLKRSDGRKNVLELEIASAELEPDTREDARSRAWRDRKDLLFGLEEGSIVIPYSPVGSFSRPFLRYEDKTDPDLLKKIIIERCMVQMDRESFSLDPKHFRIRHPDLKSITPLVNGGFKGIYKGEWCGQTVVIATIKGYPYELIEKELKLLIRLQHPKVVSFFGWDYTDEAPEYLKTKEDIERGRAVSAGFIVTEMMEYDLGLLIKSWARQKAAKNPTDSGGPFSYSVGLDILQQIVEAMLHLQEFKVRHRDLKPNNVLLNAGSSLGSDVYYDVKLIDFGSAKLVEASNEKEETYNKGSNRYGAPEMMVGPDRPESYRGPYDASGLDVFSFAMTCYEVITGWEPFHEMNPDGARRSIQENKRPLIPHEGTFPSGLKELMEECWDHVPAKRPTFEEIQRRLWTIKKQLEVDS